MAAKVESTYVVDMKISTRVSNYINITFKGVPEKRKKKMFSLSRKSRTHL